MAVPEFQSFMLPILKLFSDNKEHTTNECINEVINYFNLTLEDTKLTVPSGRQTLVANRVYWSITYLKKSLLLETVKKGLYKITLRGIELLNTNPLRIDKKLLSRYEEYRIFSNQDKNIDDNTNENYNTIEENTPEEYIDIIYNRIKEQLCDELMEIILEKDPYCFENLVMDLFKKMGYGDIDEECNMVTQKSKDEGIDGIINQDKLGLDKIYVQAKRWNGTVGRPELQKFVGALSAKKSSKGIFITTSDFSKDAKEYVNNLAQTIILINGKELTNLMIKYNVGVQNNYTYDIKKIDRDYFELI